MRKSNESQTSPLKYQKKVFQELISNLNLRPNNPSIVQKQLCFFNGIE